MWKISRKSRIRRKPQKIEQTGIKISFYIKVVVLITVIVSLITVVLTLIDKCSLPDPKQVSSPSTETPGNEQDLPPPLPPPSPPKIETIRLTVTPTETAMGSVFDGDVQIILEKISYFKEVSGKIIVYSSGEDPFSFKESPTGPLTKIGNYEIAVVDIKHNYAKFRIVRRQR